MAQNPLQQYFRQPKIFISLPSHGVYNKPGTIQGDTDHMPVFGMTGMDEILLKTPDALLTGESTMSVIKSCCPNIKDSTDLSTLDIDLVLAAIRIATFGNDLNVTHICPHCNAENDYSVDLNVLIDHYGSCKFDNKLVVDDLTITFRPLTYKQSTDFAMRNFQIQQQLNQVIDIENEDEKQKYLNDLFRQLGILQSEIFLESIESVATESTVVKERTFISEWLSNCDKIVTDKIKEHNQKNLEIWRTPEQKVSCNECSKESSFRITLDQANFFANA